MASEENDSEAMKLDLLQQAAVAQMLARGELRKCVVNGKEELVVTRKGRRAMQARQRQQDKH